MQGSDSDQSLNLSDINVSLTSDNRSDVDRRLSRSDSWTFYDTTPPSASNKAEVVVIDELVDRISNAEEDTLEHSLNVDRNFTPFNTSLISLDNSIYDNDVPTKIVKDEKSLIESMLLSDFKEEVNANGSSKSLLFEFDPFAKGNGENVYGNYESNDLMLLEALLSSNDTTSNPGSTLDLREDNENEEPTELEVKRLGVDSLTPPEPPKRFDSLPKNEYDEVEIGKYICIYYDKYIYTYI